MKREEAPYLLINDPRRGSIESQTYYPWFDWLRAACASAVVLSHDSAIGWANSGNFAVQVFFALSGWLIGSILLTLAPKDLTRFYFNRAMRIWIPYYVAVFLLLSLSILRDPITAKWLEIVSYKLTFVYNLFGTRQLAQFVNAMPEKGTLTHVWSAAVWEAGRTSPRRGDAAMPRWAYVPDVPLFMIRGGTVSNEDLEAVVATRTAHSGVLPGWVAR